MDLTINRLVFSSGFIFGEWLKQSNFMKVGEIMSSISSKKKKYLFEIHFLRAFACLAVLGVHVSATYYSMNDNTFNWFSYFLNQVGRFGTPIFVVIAGFLLFYQVKRNTYSFGKFVTSRFSKIVLPLILWSFVYRFLLYYFDNHQIGDMKTELVKIFTGDHFYHLYFIAIIVQFYFIFPILQKFFRSKLGLIILTALSLFISYNMVGFNPGMDGFIGDFIASKSFMPLWIFYFSFGGLLAFFWDDIRDFTAKFPWIMLILSLVITAGAIIEYTFNGDLTNRRVSNLLNIPLLSIATIGMYPILSQWNVMKKPLTLLGKYSMGIYLVHPLVLHLMKIYLPSSIWNMIYLPITFTFVLFICIAIIRLIQYFPLSGYFIPVPKIKKNFENVTSKKVIA
ncbi:acyltransferase [Bacillus sp. BHET2]|uniref:acyltransferase n=1 Tax=Bacillus sp. BHET2 TaxID=2583818 RepID=UPI00110E9BA0|nr:acyltransferase [Bacillus sp. BHET2]TMU84959.1 acyltransferase [Bacillus sp. BHET2]